MILERRAESPIVGLRCGMDSRFGIRIRCDVPVADLAGLVQSFDRWVVGPEQ